MCERNKYLIEKYIATFFFCSFFIILPLAFIDEKASRIFFYLCGYLSLLGIVINFKKCLFLFLTCKIIFPLLLMSLLYTVWSLLCELVSYVPQGTLFISGKRWFLAAAISSYAIFLYNHDIAQRTLIRQFCIFSLSAAFIIASVYGIWQHINASDRIVFAMNRATCAAYQYSALSLVLISVTIFNRLDLKKQYFIIILFGLLSVYVVFLTETRSAIIIHTLAIIMLILQVIFKERKLKLISLLLSILILVSIIYTNWNLISVLYNRTSQEVLLYQNGNDKTSIGARFTMWRVGVMTFINAPLGETQSSRNEKIVRFLHSEKNQNSDALRYLNVHLHNEIIQAGSLFGIYGVYILIFFYYTLIFNNNLYKIFLYNPITLLSLSALLYGLTDVILTSIEYVVIFSILLITSRLVCNEPRNSIKNIGYAIVQLGPFSSVLSQLLVRHSIC